MFIINIIWILLFIINIIYVEVGIDDSILILVYYIMIDKTKKGPIPAKKNKIIPNVVKVLFSSIIPEIINKSPINPKRIGKICENNTNPELAILSLN